MAALREMVRFLRWSKLYLAIHGDGTCMRNLSVSKSAIGPGALRRLFSHSFLSVVRSSLMALKVR